jgi:acyl carrier protein
MTEPEIYEALNEIFRRLFKDPNLTVRPETRAEDVRGWDSLAHVRLILACEKRCGVRFKTSEISEFQNVGDLVRLVQKKLLLKQ